jgi:hypothetical protein
MADAALRQEIWEKLSATLTPEQRRLFIDYDTELGKQGNDDQDVFFAEVSRHLGLHAPVLNVLLEHLNEQKTAEVGVCCSGDPARPVPAP